jgi:hypothetical protein
MIHDAFVIVVAVSLVRGEKEYCRAVFHRTVAFLSKWTLNLKTFPDIKTPVIC